MQNESVKSAIRLEKVSAENLFLAEITLHVTFPQRACDYIPDIRLALDGKTDFNYWLAYDATGGNRQPLGICSLGHAVPYDEKSVWIDAFGVTPDGAVRGVAREMLDEMIGKARTIGAKYLRTVQFLALGQARSEFLLGEGFKTEEYAADGDLCFEDSMKNMPQVFTLAIDAPTGKKALWGNKTIGLKDKLVRMHTSDSRRVLRELTFRWDIDPVTKTGTEEYNITENGVEKERWTPSQAVSVARSLNVLAKVILDTAMPKMLEMEGFRDAENAPR